MAKYFTDFSEYAYGQLDDGDWTERWNTGVTSWSVDVKDGALGGCVCSYATGGQTNAYRLISWDDITVDADRADVEILMKIRQDIAGRREIFLIARAQSGNASYAYWCEVDPRNDVFAIWKRVDYTNTQISSTISTGAIAGDSHLWCRFRVVGTSLKAKLWEDGTTEPSSWDLEVTDSDISAAGWVGFGGNNAGDTIPVACFAAATNGDTAEVVNTVKTIDSGIDTTNKTSNPGGTYQTNSLSPDNGDKLLLAFYMVGGHDSDPSVSGVGATWEKKVEQLDAQSGSVQGGIYIFSGVSNGTSGPITVTINGSNSTELFIWAVTELINSSGPGASDTDVGFDDVSTALSITYQDSGSATFTVLGRVAQETGDWATNYKRLYRAAYSSAENHELVVGWQRSTTDPDTSSWVYNRHFCTAALEVKLISAGLSLVKVVSEVERC